MKIYLSQLKKDGGNRADYHFLVGAKSLAVENESFSLVGPVSLSLTASFTGKALVINGSFKGTIRLSCSRCLEVLGLPLAGEFLEEFEAGGPAGEETLPQGFLNGEAFPLQGLLRENLILSVPLKPLCRETCQGLCPLCGQDLNRAPCQCRVSAADPRLEGLKDYFSKA